jgi:hypothetical protein
MINSFCQFYMHLGGFGLIELQGNAYEILTKLAGGGRIRWGIRGGGD